LPIYSGLLVVDTFVKKLEQEVRVTMDKDNNAVLEADGHTGGDILEINTGKISGS